MKVSSAPLDHHGGVTVGDADSGIASSVADRGGSTSASAVSVASITGVGSGSALSAALRTVRQTVMGAFGGAAGVAKQSSISNTNVGGGSVGKQSSVVGQGPGQNLSQNLLVLQRALENSAQNSYRMQQGQSRMLQGSAQSQNSSQTSFNNVGAQQSQYWPDSGHAHNGHGFMGGGNRRSSRYDDSSSRAGTGNNTKRGSVGQQTGSAKRHRQSSLGFGGCSSQSIGAFHSMSSQRLGSQRFGGGVANSQRMSASHRLGRIPRVDIHADDTTDGPGNGTTDHDDAIVQRNTNANAGSGAVGAIAGSSVRRLSALFSGFGSMILGGGIAGKEGGDGAERSQSHKSPENNDRGIGEDGDNSNTKNGNATNHSTKARDATGTTDVRINFADE